MNIRFNTRQKLADCKREFLARLDFLVTFLAMKKVTDLSTIKSYFTQSRSWVHRMTQREFHAVTRWVSRNPDLSGAIPIVVGSKEISTQKTKVEFFLIIDVVGANSNNGPLGKIIRSIKKIHPPQADGFSQNSVPSRFIGTV